MNTLTNKDTYRPESHQEYKDIAKLFYDNDILVYPELLTIEEDKYEKFPVLSWDGRMNYLDAYSVEYDDSIRNTRQLFLQKAGISMFDRQHLIHKFI